MPDRPPADPELVRRYGRSPDTVPESADPADGFLRLACLTYGADSVQRRTRARDFGHSGTARLLEAVVACPPGEAPPP